MTNTYMYCPCMCVYGTGGDGKGQMLDMGRVYADVYIRLSHLLG